jgi:transposase
MGVKKQVEKDFAKVLFVNDNVSQKEIASRLNVTEKTIGKWVKDGDWEKLKKSMLVTKENQLNMLYDQLDFLNTDIKDRDYKIATSKEADVISKLTSAIKKLETEISIGETVEVAKQLIQFIRSQDIAFANELTKYCDGFINEKMK